MTMHHHPSEPLVAIGGIGGSGTRVVAAAVSALGVHLGDDLNGSLDNLTFTLLFKDRSAAQLSAPDFAARAALFRRAMHGDRDFQESERRLLASLAVADRPAQGLPQHSAEWLQLRVQRVLAGEAGHQLAPGRAWGWKEPNTHVLLPQLRQCFPGLRYIHVVRNGLDMAFSSNLNQLDFWGEWWLGRAVARGPRDALAYWCAVQRKAMRWKRELGVGFLWLDYDALCRDPVPVLEALAAFLGAPAGAVEGLLPLIESPASLGRASACPLDAFDAADVAFLRELGHVA